MKWYWYVLVAGSAVAAGGVFLFFSPFLRTSSAPPPPAPRRPNVVLISLDTLRPDHLGCHGYRRPTSPNLDRLAGQGVRFRQARCQMPWTVQSHMSLFTSLLPSHNTVDHFEGLLPTELPTLAQLLGAHGYTTAALVHNAMMQARWGFNRGFGLWREYPWETSQGLCENLTAEALAWLGARPPEPFFLFLHYYDAHAPYVAPRAIRETFGCSLTSPRQVAGILGQYRRPEQPATVPFLLDQVRAAYDASIAALDSELGKLLDRLPDNTLVVVFSDHGEAFKEHGWLEHGATLHEEAIRSVLLMRFPGQLPAGLVVDDPVMLLDVAPTILSLCGVQPPPLFEGADLAPLWQGGRLPGRTSLAETNTPLDGRVLKMAQLGDWKMVYSLFDGQRELYRLPDEQIDRLREEPEVDRALFPVLRSWLEQEDFWTIHAHGRGDFRVTVTPATAQVSSVMPIQPSLEETKHGFERTPNSRFLEWKSSPGGGSRGLYFKLVPPDSAVTVDFQIDGKRLLEKVYLGAARANPGAIPWKSDPAAALADPVPEGRFQPAAEGIYLSHHRGKGGGGVAGSVVPLDEKTLEHLRSLGYLR